MSFFEDFVGGGAAAVADIADTQIKQNTAKSLADYQSQLDIKKQQTIEAMRLENMPKELQIKSDAANAGLNRYGQIRNKYADQAAPVDAEPVTGLIGHAQTQAGRGMVGNYDDLKKRADSMPAEDRQPYLDQLDRQFQEQTNAAQAAVAGKTRKLTSDEVDKLAADDAMRSDPAAYADFEARIGKPRRDERKIDNAEKKADQRYDAQMSKQDSDDAYRMRREDRLDSLAELQHSLSSRNYDKAELQSQRLSVTNGMQDIRKELERTEVLSANAMDPNMKAMLDKRSVSLTKDLDRYRAALESFSGGALPEREAPTPAASVKYDANGVAYVKGPDGKPMRKSDADKAASTTKQPEVIEKRAEVTAPPVRTGIVNNGRSSNPSAATGAVWVKGNGRSGAGGHWEYPPSKVARSSSPMR